MSSFSLQGLGEPMRELRELIKDARGRNGYERRINELERLGQVVTLLAECDRVLANSTHPKTRALVLDVLNTIAVPRDRPPLRVKRDLSGFDQIEGYVVTGARALRDPEEAANAPAYGNQRGTRPAVNWAELP